jgi:oligopeptide/dipeptide ABC transporter ATP-binding protein
MSETMDTAVILKAENLVKKYYKGNSGFLKKRTAVDVIDGVSFRLNRGQGFAVLGESGSGKTVLANLLSGLEAPDSGNVFLERKAVFPLTKKKRLWYFGQVQMIFQDALSSLNSAKRIGRSLESPLKNFGLETHTQSRVEILHSMLKSVGLNPKYMGRFPHELSGGECQRVNIARALVCKPKILILDEPVSGLDVSIKAQILNLLADLKDKLGLTYFLITSDPQVATFLADIIAILCCGSFVEIGSPLEITQNPVHPYTQILLSSLDLSIQQGMEDSILNEDIINQAGTRERNGCGFSALCKRVEKKCFAQTPPMEEYRESHYVACYFPGREKTNSFLRHERQRS